MRRAWRPSRRILATASFGGALALVASALACGETRRPIGDECLRSEDCLSGVCSSRTCVSAPTLVSGAESPPPDESPRIPEGEAGPDAPVDSAGGGG